MAATATTLHQKYEAAISCCVVLLWNHQHHHCTDDGQDERVNAGECSVSSFGNPHGNESAENLSTARAHVEKRCMRDTVG